MTNQSILWFNPLNNRPSFVTLAQAEGCIQVEGNDNSLLAIGDSVMDADAGVFGFIDSFYDETECLVIGDDGEETVIDPRFLSKAR